MLLVSVTLTEEIERETERDRERQRQRESMLHTRVIRIALAVFKPGCSST